MNMSMVSQQDASMYGSIELTTIVAICGAALCSAALYVVLFVLFICFECTTQPAQNVHSDRLKTNPVTDPYQIVHNTYNITNSNVYMGNVGDVADGSVMAGSFTVTGSFTDSVSTATIPASTPDVPIPVPIPVVIVERNVHTDPATVPTPPVSTPPVSTPPVSTPTVPTKFLITINGCGDDTTTPATILVTVERNIVPSVIVHPVSQPDTSDTTTPDITPDTTPEGLADSDSDSDSGSDSDSDSGSDSDDDSVDSNSENSYWDEQSQCDVNGEEDNDLGDLETHEYEYECHCLGECHCHEWDVLDDKEEVKDCSRSIRCDLTYSPSEYVSPSIAIREYAKKNKTPKTNV